MRPKSFELSGLLPQQKNRNHQAENSYKTWGEKSGAANEEENNPE